MAVSLTFAFPLFSAWPVSARKTLTTESRLLQHNSLEDAREKMKCFYKECHRSITMTNGKLNRENTKELRRMQLEDDLRKARKLFSNFIRAAEEVEERIEEVAEKGELDELVLMIIWNRLDLARCDDENDAIRSLDLLYRRVETEILKRQASPAKKLLNDLLNINDGFEDAIWLKDCRKLMAETFPREDPFSILISRGFDIDMLDLPLRLTWTTPFMRVDFVREVDALLQVRIEEDTKLVKEEKGLILKLYQLSLSSRRNSEPSVK